MTLKATKAGLVAPTLIKELTPRALAALVDEHGTLSIADGGHGDLIAVLTVTLTTREHAEMVRDYINAGAAWYANNPNRWWYQIRRQEDMLRVLTDLRPYARRLRKQIEVVLDFLDFTYVWHCRRPIDCHLYTPEVFRLRLKREKEHYGPHGP